MTDAEAQAEAVAFLDKSRREIDATLKRLCEEAGRTDLVHVATGCIAVRLAKHLGYAVNVLQQLRARQPELADNIAAIEAAVKTAIARALAAELPVPGRRPVPDEPIRRS